MSTHKHHASIATWLVVCAISLAGCTSDPEGPIIPSCDLDYTGRELDGVWTLSAHGARRACGERRLEGDLEISSSMPIRVNAQAQATEGPATGPETSAEEDAFIDRIERADFVLESTRGIEGFQISGAVNGSCVTFSMTEDLGRGDSLQYTFDGQISASGFIEGNFDGDGPKGCEVEGTFTVDIR